MSLRYRPSRSSSGVCTRVLGNGPRFSCPDREEAADDRAARDLPAFTNMSGRFADDVRRTQASLVGRRCSGRTRCVGYAAPSIPRAFESRRLASSRRPGPTRHLLSSRPSSVWTDWSLVSTSAPTLAPVRFSDLGVPRELVRSPRGERDRQSFSDPGGHPCPTALAGRDVCGMAPTGSGKTLAFGLAILSRLSAQPGARRRGRRHPSALVLVPTRELAAQIEDVIAPAGRHHRCSGRLRSTAASGTASSAPRCATAPTS